MKRPFKISDIEIDRRFKTGDKHFEQGVTLGMKSFEHFITISTAALGFLLAIKSNVLSHDLFLNGIADRLFNVSISLFGAAAIFSVFRNYHAGYGLVYLGLRFIHKAAVLNGESTKKSKHLDAKKKQKCSEEYRQYFSFLARTSFVGALIAFAWFVINVGVITDANLSA